LAERRDGVEDRMQQQQQQQQRQQQQRRQQVTRSERMRYSAAVQVRHALACQ
jgi:hypothetical protein